MTSQHNKAKRWQFGVWKLWAIVTCVCLLLGARSVRSHLEEAQADYRAIVAWRAWEREFPEWYQKHAIKSSWQFQLNVDELLKPNTFP